MRGVTKPVVIKKVLPHYVGNKSFDSMFVNEAKIAVGLAHGNIAQVFDLGREGETPRGARSATSAYVDCFPRRGPLQMTASSSACMTTCALVRILEPSITTPEPDVFAPDYQPDDIAEIAQKEDLTIRQMYERVVPGLGESIFKGNAVQVADQMEEWFDGDSAALPGTLVAYSPTLRWAYSSVATAQPKRKVEVVTSTKCAQRTASDALSLGRAVMAVPGPVTSAMSVGCHQLVRDGALHRLAVAHGVVRDRTGASWNQSGATAAGLEL